MDAAGNLDGCYDYGAFGDERHNTVMIENRYRYTSREYVEPNLYYYRARYMRPDLGRFVSMDPLKMIDGTNMFGYVRNDPITYLDQEGTVGVVEVIGGGILIYSVYKCWRCADYFVEYGLKVCRPKCNERQDWFCNVGPTYANCWMECMNRKLGFKWWKCLIGLCGKLIPLPGASGPGTPPIGPSNIF